MVPTTASGPLASSASRSPAPHVTATAAIPAARAAGMAAVAVTWGAAERVSLAASGPDAVVDTMAGLEAQLLGRAGT